MRGATVMTVIAASGLAIVAGASAVDRSLPAGVRLSGLLPHIGAQTAAAEADVLDGIKYKKPAIGLQASRRLIEGNPISQRYVAQYGALLLLAGNNDAARRAFTVAAELGWRDPTTQTYWLSRALLTGDVLLASLRLDALLRTQNTNPQSDEALAALESIPQGRVALARRLKEKPDWADSYVSDIPNLENDRAVRRVATVSLAGLTSADLEPSHVQSAVRGLWLRRLFPVSFQLWRELKGDGDFRRSGLWDADFGKSFGGDPVSPYQWNLLHTVATNQWLGDSGSGDGGLHVSGDQALIETVAEQHTQLPPGTYRIDWRLKGAKPGTESDLSVNVRCNGSDTSLTAQIIWSAVGGSRSMTVPANCGDEVVEIVHKATSGSSNNVDQIQHIQINPAL